MTSREATQASTSSLSLSSPSMPDTCESSSANTNDKAVIVRVKRKPAQFRLGLFWLIINGNPKKLIYVQHVETVCSYEATIDALQSYMKQEQLLLRVGEKHEVSAEGAGPEDISTSRKATKDIVHDDSLHELCQLYDLIRVDNDKEARDAVNPDCKMSFPSCLRECLPDVPPQVQANIESCANVKESSNDYVYDLYAVEKRLEEQLIAEDDLFDGPSTSGDGYGEWEFSRDGYYGGPKWSDGYYCDQIEAEDYAVPQEYDETSDSNDENNPQNDYHDYHYYFSEEESCEEDEDKSETTLDESEELESRSSDHDNAASQTQSDIESNVNLEDVEDLKFDESFEDAMQELIPKLDGHCDEPSDLDAATDDSDRRT